MEKRHRRLKDPQHMKWIGTACLQMPDLKTCCYVTQQCYDFYSQDHKRQPTVRTASHTKTPLATNSE
jgi:hypothetical protein